MERSLAADIVEVAARYTVLRRDADGDYGGLCPYPDHSDLAGQFRVSPKAGYYFCRGCGRGGAAAKLVADLEGGEAVAARADIPEQRGACKALAYAARYYASYLSESKDAGARQARGYLAGRGIEPEALALFSVGYAPLRRKGTGFSGAAKRMGVGREDVEAAGLLNTRGGDRFGERIVFPITDARGRTVGFGGRVLPDAPASFTNREGREVPIAKYLNSRDSEVFSKKSLLYGLPQALPSIRAKRSAIVVEGYTDVLMMHQRGLTNAVATLGTALTVDHLRRLSPYADTLYLVFDPDAAGGAAVVRAYEVAWTSAAALDVRVAVLDEDPADFLLRHDAHDLRGVLADAKPTLLHMTEGRAADEAGEDADEGARKAWAKLGAFVHTRLYLPCEAPHRRRST